MEKNEKIAHFDRFRGRGENKKKKIKHQVFIWKYVFMQIIRIVSVEIVKNLNKYIHRVPCLQSTNAYAVNTVELFILNIPTFENRHVN